ncbi:hypothetical protein ABE61_14500 [Lysinibacillus sphaericus]|nr:hypothetical protein [Lysinibacillus sphaericus]MBG9478775.1 hypothetical protein [Lysinibacillus sphaericus]MBG9592503.1 hypothetical protein [Lysinibacillus sphaericus]
MSRSWCWFRRRYQAFIHGVFIEELLIVYRDFLEIYRELLIVYRDLFEVYRDFSLVFFYITYKGKKTVHKLKNF